MFVLQIGCILLLTLIPAVLIVISVFSTSWWTLDVTEYSQEWQFGLWKYCRRGGDIHVEVSVRGVDLRQWICDLRTTPPNAENYREQTSFIGIDHGEIPGAFCHERVSAKQTLQC